MNLQPESPTLANHQNACKNTCSKKYTKILILPRSNLPQKCLIISVPCHPTPGVDNGMKAYEMATILLVRFSSTFSRGDAECVYPLVRSHILLPSAATNQTWQRQAPSEGAVVPPTSLQAAELTSNWANHGYQAPDTMTGDRWGRARAGGEAKVVSSDVAVVELDRPQQLDGALVLKSEKIVYCPIQKVGCQPAPPSRAVGPWTS